MIKIIETSTDLTEIPNQLTYLNTKGYADMLLSKQGCGECLLVNKVSVDINTVISYDTHPELFKEGKPIGVKFDTLEDFLKHDFDSSDGNIFNIVNQLIYTSVPNLAQGVTTFANLAISMNQIIKSLSDRNTIALDDDVCILQHALIMYFIYPVGRELSNTYVTDLLRSKGYTEPLECLHFII